MDPFDPDDLSAKLRTWKVEPEVPSSFQREVWQRIAAAQSVRENALWRKILQWIDLRLEQPQYATALVAISLAASLCVAHLHADSTTAKHWRALEERYGASVDPMAMMNRSLGN